MAVSKAPGLVEIDHTALRGPISQSDSLSFQRCFDPQEDALDELADAVRSLLFDGAELAEGPNLAARTPTCFFSCQEQGMC
jgi:hypothetical protein